MSRVVPLITSTVPGELEELLTVEDVAKLLRVHKNFIYRYTRRRKDMLPHFKIGRYTRFLEADVRRWRDRQRKG